MRANVSAYYRILPHELKSLPFSKIKEAYINIVYYNKKLKEEMN